MTAVERKVVHVRLKDYAGVVTRSEGTEPNRFVVDRPRVTRALARRARRHARADLVCDGDEARRVLARREPRGASSRSQRFEGPIVDVGSGGGAPGIPLARRAARARGDAARGDAAQVRLPRALDRRAAEPARRLRPRRGAAARRVRRRRREGARAAAGRGRVVPAARRAGRRGGALRRPDAPRPTAVARGRRAARRASSSRARRRACSSLRKLGPTPAGFPRRPGRGPETSARVA